MATEKKAYPRNRDEFQAWFRDEEACAEYIARLRWPDGFVCAACGADRTWSKTRRRLACSVCRRETTVTSGTILDGTHKPLRTWLAAIWQTAEESGGISAKDFQRTVGLGSYKTAWLWFRKLHAVVAPREGDRLRGTIELDYVLVPWRVPLSGQRSEGVTVAIGVEVRRGDLGRIRVGRVADPSPAVLAEFAALATSPGSIVLTDGSASPSGPSRAEYEERTVVSGPTGLQRSAAFPSVRAIAASLADWLRQVRQAGGNPAQMDFYLDEFAFRFNHRSATADGEMFYLLLKRAVGAD